MTANGPAITANGPATTAEAPAAEDVLDPLLDLIAVALSVGEHAQHQYVEVHGVRLTRVKLTY